MLKPDIRQIEWAIQNTIDVYGQPNKVEPSQTIKDQGWGPEEYPPYNWENWIKNQYYQWFLYLQANNKIPHYLSPIGNSLTIAGASSVALMTLLNNNNEIAFIDGTNESLRKYRFDGVNWSLVGSGLTITGVGAGRLSSMTGSRVALISSSLNVLRAYDFNGTNWSLTGNSFSLTLASPQGVAALSTDTVAIADGGVGQWLRAYQFDGTDWTLLGNSLSIGDLGGGVIVPFGENRVAIYNNYSGTRTYRVYEFDGTDWSSVGNFTTTTRVAIDIAAITENIIILYELNDDSLLFVKFDGADWSEIGSNTIVSTPDARLCVLSTGHIVFYNTSSPAIQTQQIYWDDVVVPELLTK